MGRDFDKYLAFTVFLCVAEREDIKKSEAHSGRWNLRKHGWPSLPTDKQTEAATKWIEEKFKDIQQRRAPRTDKPTNQPINPEDVAWALMSPLAPRTAKEKPSQTELRRLLGLLKFELLLHGGYNVSGFSPFSEDAICERAIRSLHDWRATLNFLSEIKLSEDNHLLLGEPDHAIIDSFNVHITRGRRPNFAHNMLCHLAGPARFRIILTTNFDPLIEDAFLQMREQLEVISVSTKGTLPAPELVHARNTVVKLHGTIWETRADFSLDESPSQESLNRFFHYVRGRYPDDRSNGSFIPAHLLVCGYSGSDRRCIEMIKFILDAGDDTAKIFWICNSDKGLQDLKSLFPESYGSRVIAVATPRTDLLLYELYQHLCLSLPKGGFSYQYTANVPPRIPSNLAGRVALKEIPDAENLATQCSEIVRWYKKQEPESEWGNPYVMDGQPGVLATLRNSIEYIGEKKLSTGIVWLELEDYSDVFSLAYDLCLIISIRLGLFQLGHADLLPTSFIHRLAAEQTHSTTKQKVWEKHLRTITRDYLNIDPTEWLVVLYGRNGAGGCSAWNELVFWKDSEQQQFIPFVTALAACGFRIIHAPYSRSRREGDDKKIDLLPELVYKELHEHPSVHPFKKMEYKLPEPDQIDVTNAHSPDSEDESIVKQGNSISFKRAMSYLLSEWIDRRVYEKQRDGLRSRKDQLQCYRFLYASTLFRQSRHYSAFLNDGIVKCPLRFNDKAFDNDWERDEMVRGFREELITKNIFYEKPGGFAWAYRDFRMGLRWIIDTLPQSYCAAATRNTRTNSKSPLPERFHTWRSHYHYWIADWYLRAFYTTGHATPLMEALFHLYQTIKNLKHFRADATFAHTSNKNKPAKERAWRRYRRWRNAICDMIKALRVGRHSIRLWFGPAQFRVWFSDQHTGQEVLENCKPDPEIFKYLDADDQHGLVQHAKKLYELFAAEFQRLTPPDRDASRLKEFGLFVLPDIPKTAKNLSLLNDANKKDDDQCWKDAPLIVRNLCQAVFEGTAAGGKELSHKVTCTQRMELQNNYSDAHFFRLIQELNEWAFILLRRAKMRQRHNLIIKRKSKPPLGQCPVVRKLWISVSVLCNTSLDFCRLLHPGLESFEVKERVKALCLYAVSLGRLGRFYEAHRRLNEANALLSKHESQESRVLLGILKLRRAEVHLMESYFVNWFINADKKQYTHVAADHVSKRYFGHNLATHKKKLATDKKRGALIALAKLDDTWCALETAEYLLAGQTHSPRWWARLCCLKLQCLMEFHNRSNTGYTTLGRRVPSDPLHQVYDLLKKGLASCHGNHLLQLRLLDFAYHTAITVYKPSGLPHSPILHAIKKLWDDSIANGPENARKTLTVNKYEKRLSKLFKGWV